MLFSSNEFLFAFLPIVLLLYYLAPRKLHNSVLLLLSLVFYGWGEPVYLLLMLVTILLNFLFGWWIARQKSMGKSGKLPLVCGVAANLVILGYFKYAGFLLGMLPFVESVPEISLPIGISFYVFQSMGYAIDVYRGKYRAEDNFFKFALSIKSKLLEFAI